jgi:heme exporter protein C
MDNMAFDKRYGIRDMLWLKILIGILMTVMILLSFLTERPVAGFGDEFRIFYYHVPMAIVSMLAFLVNLIFSIRYLRDRRPLDDIRARSASELGLLFGILATISGSIFARVAWGSFWNWDIRETSFAILLVIYGAYFALRSAVEPEERSAVFASVYSVLAFLSVPVFGFIVPRIYNSLHPKDTLISGGKLALGGTVAIIFVCSLLAFLLLFYWIYNLRWRAVYLERYVKEKSYE